MHFLIGIRLLLLALLLAGSYAVAQDEVASAKDDPVENESDIPDDRLNRGTPSGSGTGFILAVDKSDFETAAEYLDLRNIRGEASHLTGPQLARRLAVIIARGNWIDSGELVNDPEGRSGDGLPDYRDSLGVVLDDAKEYRLYMQKVPRGDGVSIWKVSNATVTLIPELYDTYGYPEPIEKLRRVLPNISILGFELFKWVLVVAVGIAAYSFTFLVALVIRRILGDPNEPSRRRVFRFISVPVGIWVVIMSTNFAATRLGRGVTTEALDKLSPVSTLVTVWVLFAGINLLRDIYAGRLQRSDRTGAAVLLNPVTNAIKLLIALGAFLFYLDKIGIDITTVLAGLGVGGIAVALALQKPMADVFGAITLYTQQPVRIGDFCRIGTQTGTIEEIGLQTTRVRTLANTVIAIPNSQLATEPIDNISARHKILYRTNLRLKYDATPDQIRQVLAGIRDMLVAHDRVLQDNHRVRFNEIGDDALSIEVYAYFNTTVWSEYLELAEGLNLQILEIVERAGTKLSLPARTLQIEQVDEE